MSRGVERPSRGSEGISCACSILARRNMAIDDREESAEVPALRLCSSRHFKGILQPRPAIRSKSFGSSLADIRVLALQTGRVGTEEMAQLEPGIAQTHPER